MMKLTGLLLSFSLLFLYSEGDTLQETLTNRYEASEQQNLMTPQEEVPLEDEGSTDIPPLDEDIFLQEEEVAPAYKGLVVIDAGHQGQGNSDKEPVGPGASTTKAKVSSGTTGRFTGIPEYVLTLAVALYLEEILLEMNYEVVQIRSTHDVDISNAERAIIANDLNADAFIRIHADGSTDSSVNGAYTLCPTAQNPYCPQIYTASRLLSEKVLDGIIQETGARRRSIMETDSMTGINWCTVPVTIIEMGFMTNEVEDRLLATEEYRYAMAKGMAIGIDLYIDAVQS